MVVQITRREVLYNLIRFKDILLSKGVTGREATISRREYTAFFNRRTGEIQFSHSMEAYPKEMPEEFDQEREIADWLEIHLIAEDTQKTVRFHLVGPEGSSLKPTELDPAAVRILFETLDVLNQLASQYLPSKQALPEKMILQHLSDVHIAPVQEDIESMQGWSGQISRLEAEKKLLGRTLGTYLLRGGDKITAAVGAAFAQANEMPVRIYILTFVEGEQKISDRLLLQTQWGWTIVRDNSDLSSAVYDYHQSLDALIRSMSDQLVNPIPFFK